MTDVTGASRKRSFADLSPIFIWLCTAGAACFSLIFCYVALLSMNYPFNLEWMEGQTIDIMQRIRNGLPVYAEPSIDYVAYIYTPLYYYVSAWVSWITGLDFFPARLVSFVSTLGCAAVICAWIRKEKGDWAAGLIGAGLYLATYRLSGRWFDNARVDSLFLCLTLAGLYVFYHYRGWRAEILAALLVVAGFFTKQTALLIAGPAIAAFIFVDMRHTIRTGTLAALFLLVAVGIYDHASDGWFNFFVFTQPAGHSIAKPLVWIYWKGDLLPNVGIMLVVSVVMACVWALDDWRKGLAYAGLWMGFLGAGYMSRLHAYGYINVLMPAHAGLALFCGLAIAYFQYRRDHLLLVALSVIVMVQMWQLRYNPLPFIPTRQSVDTGNKFLEQIGKIEGDIMLPELQFVQTRVGKKSYALGMAAFDLLRAKLKEPDNEIQKKFRQELLEAISSGRFTAVMPGRVLMLPQVHYYYRYERNIPYPREYVTGAINLMQTNIYTRNPDAKQRGPRP